MLFNRVLEAIFFKNLVETFFALGGGGVAAPQVPLVCSPLDVSL